MIRLKYMSSRPAEPTAPGRSPGAAVAPAAPELDVKEFCRICGKFATGVMVATVVGRDGAPHGITVNSFTSVSLDPMLVLFCVDNRARILGHFLAGGSFALNVLSERQEQLSRRFARSDVDRFESVDWQPGRTGAPLLRDTIGWLECQLSQTVAAGDHTILIGRPIKGGWREGRPLVYFGSAYCGVE